MMENVEIAHATLMGLAATVRRQSEKHQELSKSEAKSSEKYALLADKEMELSELYRELAEAINN